MLYTRALVYCTALSLAGCGGYLGSHRSDGGGGGDAGQVTTGCLAGVVVDGVSGQRIDVSGAEALANFFVLRGNDRLAPAPMLAPGQAATRPSLTGEYILCGVPLEAELPLYVTLPGYQPFHATVLVASTDASRGAGADTDLTSTLPTAQANVRLYPLAATAQPFTVVVSAAGAPLADAQVTLAPTGLHTLALGSGFLPPDPTYYRILKGKTDANGAASFAAGDLSLGSIYNYQVIPADASLQKTKNGTLAVGFVTTPGEPYTYHVDLEPADSELIVVSSSLATQDYKADGSVTYYFNRPVELVPGSADQITATLDHAVAATLADNQAGNDASEQVDVTVAGQALTLKPRFTHAADKSVEPGAGLTFAGIKVRPASGAKLLHTLSLAPSVKLFGGVAAPSVATALSVVSGNDQSNSPGYSLAQPLVVRVLDQYNQPMAGVPVTFTPASGAGSVGTPSATTNAQGQAQTSWTLGASGTQSVTAAATGTSVSVPFNASFLAASNITVLSGNSQSALVATKLALPLTVRVTDANGVNVQNADVTFTVADQTNGGTLAPLGGTQAKTQTIKSSATGQSAVEWTLGATGNNYSVTVTCNQATPRTFTATAQMPTTLVLTSGNNQTANANATVASPLVVTVRDQNTNVIQGVTVQFTTATTGGTLTIGASGPAATVTGASNASGQVSATWKLGTAATTANSAIASIPAFAGVPAVTFSAMTN